MTLSLYSKADPEALKTLISGDTIPVMEYSARAICKAGKVSLDGGVFPGPFKNQSLWMPLYQSVQVAVTEILEEWMIKNVESIAPIIFKFPNRMGLFSLETCMGLKDDGQPYLNSKYTAHSDQGNRFIESPEGERARLMCLQMAGTYIDNLGKEIRA